MDVMKLKRTLLALAIVGAVATAGFVGAGRSLAAKQDKPCACCTCDNRTCCACTSCSCSS
jgi:hypothetical protein